MPNAAQLRENCAWLGVPVAYTAQPGGMTQQQRGLLRDFWGPGMAAAPGRPAHRRRAGAPSGTTGADQVALQRLPPHPSCCSGCAAAGRDQLIVCGVYAHVGVLITAVDAFSHDIQPFLVADAVADFTADDHRWP